jgi:hypothetical protein
MLTALYGAAITARVCPRGAAARRVCKRTGHRQFILEDGGNNEGPSHPG